MYVVPISSNESEPPPLHKEIFTHVCKYLTFFIIHVYRNDFRLNHQHALPIPFGR